MRKNTCHSAMVLGDSAKSLHILKKKKEKEKKKGMKETDRMIMMMKE